MFITNIVNVLKGASTSQVKLNLNLLEDIVDDFDFCLKLAKEESVIIMPGKQTNPNKMEKLTIMITLYKTDLHQGHPMH